MMEALNPLALVLATAQIAAALALLNGILTTLGQGSVASHAVEGIARQPEARGSIMTAMFIGCGFAETSGVYGLVIAFILLYANPIVNQAVSVWG